MTDSEIESLRWLVDPATRREAAQGLIPQIEALLNRSDDEIQRFFAETFDGLTFDSPAEARSWLQMFQAFLTWNSSD
jgi:uroporphyrinogen-III synthase